MKKQAEESGNQLDRVMLAFFIIILFMGVVVVTGVIIAKTSKGLPAEENVLGTEEFGLLTPTPSGQILTNPGGGSVLPSGVPVALTPTPTPKPDGKPKLNPDVGDFTPESENEKLLNTPSPTPTPRDINAPPNL